MKRPYTYLAATLAILTVMPAGAATLTIADSTFANSDWTSQSLYDTGFTSVALSNGQSFSDGNAAPFRSTSYSMVWSGVQTYGSVYAWSFYQGATFTPSSQGAVNTLDYTEDNKRIFADWSPAAVAANALLRQNGSVYIGPFYVFGPDQFWQTKSYSGLTASDFIEVNLGGDGQLAWNYSAHPDFSATGSTLEFGYSRSNSYSFTSSIGHGIDNWAYTLNYTPTAVVPLLPSAWLLGSGLLGLIGVARRRLALR